MVHLCHLYGRHFQYNLPIIHSPTFDILKASPILLFAIMLVGACYSEGSIPQDQVTKLAIRLLTIIEAEPVRLPCITRLRLVLMYSSTRYTCNALQSQPFRLEY